MNEVLVSTNENEILVSTIVNEVLLEFGEKNPTFSLNLKGHISGLPCTTEM